MYLFGAWTLRRAHPQNCYVGSERIQKVRQDMKWYKENTFLVMSKDMKYKDSLETVGGLLEQAGLSYSKIRFPG